MPNGFHNRYVRNDGFIDARSRCRNFQNALIIENIQTLKVHFSQQESQSGRKCHFGLIGGSDECSTRHFIDLDNVQYFWCVLIFGQTWVLLYQ